MMMDRYIDFIINNERLVNNVIHYYIIHNKKIDDNAPLLLAASPATTYLSLFTITNFISSFFFLFLFSSGDVGCY